MAHDPEFDDAFGKCERKERRPRALAFVGVTIVSTIGLLIACVIPILLCDQANSEPAIETPVFEKMVTPVAASATADSPYYLIVNRETGQCMEMPAGTTESRAQVEQFLVNGGDNQMWRIQIKQRLQRLEAEGKTAR